MKTAAAALTALLLICLGAPTASADGGTSPETSPPTAAAAPNGEATPAPAAAAPATEPPPATATSHRTIWPWIIMGTGVGLVITAGVIELIAVKEDDKREQDETKLTALGNTTSNDPNRQALQASIDQHDKSAKNGRTAATVIGAVGFLAIAGAVVWWFVEGGGSPDPKAKSDAKAKPTFTPSLLPGYAGATFGATF